MTALSYMGSYLDDIERITAKQYTPTDGTLIDLHPIYAIPLCRRGCPKSSPEDCGRC